MARRRKHPDPGDEPYREEAERLALLPVEEQRQVIELHRRVASNPAVPQADRDEGMRHAEALERLLGLARKPGKKK
jgi:hypothetical protein